MRLKLVAVIVTVLIAVDILVWIFAFSSGTSDETALYFLNVGQGDSQLIELPGGVQVLIDGGPNSSVLSELSRILPDNDRYIDLALATHPQLDHIGGLIDVLETYEVGLVVTSGRQSDSSAYDKFSKIISERNIRSVVLGEGDTIQYGDATLSVLSPSEKLLLNSEVNETSLVTLLETPELRALYTGDAGFEVEKYITDRYDVSADILKVGHHGSKNSSDSEFLTEVNPKVSIIGVGENNYGHPTEETIGRLQSVGSNIYTTLDQGTLKLTPSVQGINIYSIE